MKTDTLSSDSALWALENCRCVKRYMKKTNMGIAYIYALRAGCSIGQNGLFPDLRRICHQWRVQGNSDIRCTMHEFTQCGTKCAFAAAAPIAAFRFPKMEKDDRLYPISFRIGALIGPRLNQGATIASVSVRRSSFVHVARAG